MSKQFEQFKILYNQILKASLEIKNLITEEEINEHFEYFMEHGDLNKDFENSPVILADRIFVRKNGSVDINSEYTYDFKQIDRKSTRLNSSHPTTSRMPSSA